MLKKIKPLLKIPDQPIFSKIEIAHYLQRSESRVEQIIREIPVKTKYGKPILPCTYNGKRAFYSAEDAHRIFIYQGYSLKLYPVEK
jgi:hypothetical protein